MISFAAPPIDVHAEPARIRIALLVNRGTEASEFRKEFKNKTDDYISYQIIHNEDLRDGALKNFEALIIPGGSATTESISMGQEARDEIKRFIREGGIYLGVCAGAYLASCTKPVYLGLLPVKCYDEEHWLRTDGTPKLLVELTPAGQEVFGIKSKNVRITYEDGPVFSPPFEKPDDSFVPLGFFREEVVADGGVRGVMIGAPAAILSRYGKGIVLVISPHPEETPGLKQVELHAIRWLYEHRNNDLAPHVTNEKCSDKIAIIKQAERSSTISPANRMQSPQPENLCKLGEEALRLAESIFDRATVVRYLHRDVPAARQINSGPDEIVQVRTDCSGFISYLVKSVAPRHYAAVRAREPGCSYPQAKIWARFFTSLDTDRPYDGWIRVKSWQDLKPGDIVAWKEGKANSSNTGHVMMVVNQPSNVQQENGFRFVSVPVIDASSVYHFPPEHLPPKAYQKHRNGLGVGCIRIILSEEDVPIGYWEGTYWGEGEKEINRPTLSNVIGFGRMVHIQESEKTSDDHF